VFSGARIRQVRVGWTVDDCVRSRTDGPVTVNMISPAASTPTQQSWEALSPAIPTDTCAVLQRLLLMSEDARRRHLEESASHGVARNMMPMLLRALKLRDPGILLHSQRIAVISSGVARLLGWDDEQRRQLEIAALLHDLGKLGIPEHILKKPGKLSSEEYDFVLRHHHAAVNLLQALQTDATVISMLSMLFLNFDGGTAAAELDSLPQELPLGARILAVADAYDSLTNAKPYRRGMTHADAMTALEEKSGSRYDGNVVRALHRWYEAEGDSLFRYTDPLQTAEMRSEVSDQQKIGIVVLTQVLNVLYQFQELYDGYFILDSFGNYTIWSDGMPGMTGLPLQGVLGRCWHPADVQLSSITDDKAVTESREETAVGQAIRNGRAQFSSKLCRISDTRHLKVDVYTMPITGPNNQVLGVVQLLRNKSGVRRQCREYVELKLAATRDALTGVANRGQLETQLRHLLEEFHTHEGTRYLSAIFLDVDKFKRINDTYGHHTGDEVLVDLTRLLQHETYSGEIIGRYGGEEFVLICPDTDIEAAVRRAERLRLAIMKSSIGGVSTLSVTSSFGVSTAKLGDTVQTLLERADTCLYRAKETGRNRTCWEGQETESAVAVKEPEETTTVQTSPGGAFQFNDHIEVSTSLELTAMKLHAFVREYKVEILKQEIGQMSFRMGSLGFTRRWGSTKDRQPLEVSLRFDVIRTTNENYARCKTIRRMSVTATPLGKVPNMETFSQRCGTLMRELRAYLLGS
jgi:diguanylate cyclase (GGDEF)-like protein